MGKNTQFCFIASVLVIVNCKYIQMNTALKIGYLLYSRAGKSLVSFLNIYLSSISSVLLHLNSPISISIPVMPMGILASWACAHTHARPSAWPPLWHERKIIAFKHLPQTPKSSYSKFWSHKTTYECFLKPKNAD